MINFIIFILFYFTYLIIKKLKYKTYINGLETLKTELYSKALLNNVNIDSEDYKKSVFKLDTMIETAKEHTIIDFLYFRFVIFERDKKDILKRVNEIEKMLYIKNEKMKKIDSEIYEKALILSLRQLYLGSFIGWIYTFFVGILILCKLPNIIIKDKISISGEMKKMTEPNQFLELKMGI